MLKIRVRVDGHVKCDEAAPRYQFAPPNDYGEVGGEQETATTSLMVVSFIRPPGHPRRARLRAWLLRAPLRFIVWRM